jgi:NAD-dependent dihydropyrimidine dehydrogenase PreA subunit
MSTDPSNWRKMTATIVGVFWEVFHTFFRHFNFPCRLGLIRVGNPDRNSPVFVSGNYTLTVRRLLRKLAGQNCYLLVVNSRGSNVWCAVGMNEFSEYDVIDAVRVTGIAQLVAHRRLILPVYAAPGIDVGKVKQESGFHVHWGPTHLNDLPRYIENGLRRTNDMYQVKFGLQDRLEQALANGTAYSLSFLLLLIWWPAFFVKTMGVMFGVFLFTFCLYPLFPEEKHWRRTLLQLAILCAGLLSFALWRGWPLDLMLRWEGVLAAMVLLAALDACGGTPLHKTGLDHWITKGNYHSMFNPVVDPDLCINCMQCVLVCPVVVFAARRTEEKTVVSVKPMDCEECLACVKQCPTDAIFNRSGLHKGDVKSIPRLEYLVKRDCSHLRGEDRWIGAPTQFRNGFPVVIEHESDHVRAGTMRGHVRA